MKSLMMMLILKKLKLITLLVYVIRADLYTHGTHMATVTVSVLELFVPQVRSNGFRFKYLKGEKF